MLQLRPASSSGTSDQRIDLNTPLSIGSAFCFPIQNAAARREVLVGAAALLVPFVGWLMNVGHRIQPGRARARGRHGGGPVGY